MRMKSKYRFLLLMICAFALMIVSAFSLAACGSDADIYYLSLGDTYQTEKDVPANYKFARDDGNKNIYSLEIPMESDTQFTVKRVGSEETIGYSSLFTATDKLTLGENETCKVVYDGVYVLRYDVSTKILTYSYKANITGISIVAPTSLLRIGESLRFAAEVEQSDGESNADVAWTSSNPSIATVSKVGVVKALAEGEVTITAEAGDFSDAVEISIMLPETDATGIDVTPKTLSLEVGETEQLTATVSPRNASQNVSWWVDEDKQSIVTVSVTGVVKAVGAGTATVHVVTASGLFETECEVTVIRHVDLVKISASKLQLVANGQQKTLSVSVAPSDATDSSYTYSLLDGSECVEINKNGDGDLILSGIQEGEATLMVVSSDNETATAFCQIEVLAATSSAVNILPQNRQMMIGDNLELEVNLEGKTIQSVEWGVDHTSVASIKAGAMGKATVTANAFGSAIVTATVTVTDGGTCTATCNILVTDDFYFIYGYGLGAYDWDYQDYLTDRNAAEKAGILFKEVGVGTYSLTRHFTPSNGFQIIFPKVAAYTEDDGDGNQIWNKNMPSQMVPSTTYYDSSRSDASLIGNRNDQFKVNAAGVYTVYLDLTGESAKVFFENQSVDVEEIGLTLIEGRALLWDGDDLTLSLSVSPSLATFTRDNIEISLVSAFAKYADYIDYAFDYDTMTINIRVKADPTEQFDLEIHCTVLGVETSFEVVVYPSSMQERPVTSIAFDQSAYYYNVNNGGEAWETMVHAAVNDSASIQDVRYSAQKLSNTTAVLYSVDPISGLVTSNNQLGTVIITATAVGDSNMTATCTVTFYSDTFYLAGYFNTFTKLNGYEVLGQESTTLDASSRFAPYKFTMVSETYFKLETTISNYRETGGSDGFQIVHLGMNETWDSALTSGNRNVSGMYDYYTYFDYFGDNMRVLVTGDYVIEVDLSGMRGSFTINWKATNLQEIRLSASETELKAGESAEVNVQFGPKYQTPSENAISWTLTGDGASYAEYRFDYATGICTLTASNSDFSEDKTVTLTCSVEGVEAKSVTFTIIAQHHLKWDADNENHWQVCTDVGCGYQTTPQAHQRDDKLDFDGKYHFHACDICGEGKIDVKEHKFTVWADGWYDGDGKCEECDFNLYTVENGVLLKYNGQLKQVQLPTSITSIGEGAFKDNIYLEEIDLPVTVTFVDRKAFQGCTALRSASLPGVKDIRDYLFDGCINLSELTLNEGITTIGLGAFRNCISLKGDFVIPNTVTQNTQKAWPAIGANAFTGTSVNIVWGDAPRVTQLNGFQGWLGTHFEIPSNVVHIVGGCFEGAVNLQSIVVPDSVIYLGASTFRGCTSLRYAEISNSVYQTHAYLFADCTSLEYVLFKMSNFWYVENDTFTNTPALKAVYFTSTSTRVVQMTGISPNNFFHNGNDDMIGKCYCFSSQPVLEPNCGVWTKYFAGTWCYDDLGERTLDHVKVWTQADIEDAASATPAQVTLYIDPKRK